MSISCLTSFISDGALVFDNSHGEHELVAQKTIDENLILINEIGFNNLKKCYDNS